MKYITKNPNNCTIDDIQRENDVVFDEILSVRNQFNNDISCRTGDRLVYEHLGIEFSLNAYELETVFWTAATPGAVMPHTEKMLEYLSAQNIRTGVISNIAWSGEVLHERINRLLPNNSFEFVMASSDYMIRKPDKRLFEIALHKSGLSANKVWYCGDSIKADVYGAHNAGIYPVLYEGETEEVNPFAEQNDGLEVDFNYLHIHDWREMIEVLEGYK